MKVDREHVTETINSTGKNLLGVIKKLVHQGNIRKITIKTKEGRVLVEFPLTIGVLGAALAPLFMIVATLGVLISDLVIYVEKDKDITPKKDIPESDLVD